MRCLTNMLEHSKNGVRMLRNGAVVYLVDLLGPPPEFIIKNEKDRLAAHNAAKATQQTVCKAAVQGIEQVQ